MMGYEIFPIFYVYDMYYNSKLNYFDMKHLFLIFLHSLFFWFHKYLNNLFLNLLLGYFYLCYILYILFLYNLYYIYLYYFYYLEFYNYYYHIYLLFLHFCKMICLHELDYHIHYFFFDYLYIYY